MLLSPMGPNASLSIIILSIMGLITTQSRMTMFMLGIIVTFSIMTLSIMGIITTCTGYNGHSCNNMQNDTTHWAYLWYSA